jgi:transcriptional regulator with XRE-family HTH domain
MNLGKSIRMCRKKRGLKQAELAKLANISVSHLCLLEKDKRDPSLSAVSAISDALKIPVSVLVLLASQYGEIKELSENQIEELSRNILGILDSADRQESLF